MKVLITGIGITGKSSLRRLLVKKLREFGISVKHYDADEFNFLRHSAEADCLKKLPRTFQDNTLYLIEDIHGVGTEAVLSLDKYDLVLYLKTGLFSHLMFWFPRVCRWFLQGKFAWEQKTGWKGTGKPRDYRNIIPIVKDILRDFSNRKKWILEDIQKLNSTCPRFLVVKSRWSSGGPKFILEAK